MVSSTQKRSGILAAALATQIGCSASLGSLEEKHTMPTAECIVKEARLGIARTSALTPEHLTVITGDSLFELRANSNECAERLASGTGVTVRTSRGVVFLPFHNPMTRQGSTLTAYTNGTNIRRLYDVEPGIPSYTNIGEQVGWQFQVPGGQTIQDNAFFHILLNAWQCSFSLPNTTNIQASEISTLTHTVNYSDQSVGPRTFCIALNHPNMDMRNDLTDIIRDIQRPMGSCLLDMPNACTSGQVCDTRNQCVNSNWCVTLNPGTAATLRLPTELSARLARETISFQFVHTSASSFGYTDSSWACNDAPTYTIIQ